MTSPMPIDELPSFLAKNNRVIQAKNDPWLKYVIVEGILLFGIVISAAIIGKQQENKVRIKSAENENGNK